MEMAPEMEPLGGVAGKYEHGDAWSGGYLRRNTSMNGDAFGLKCFSLRIKSQTIDIESKCQKSTKTFPMPWGSAFDQVMQVSLESTQSKEPESKRYTMTISERLVSNAIPSLPKPELTPKATRASNPRRL